MKWIAAILRLGDHGWAWLWQAIGGMTEGAIRGIVRAKNEPRTIRYYSTDRARIDHIIERVDALRLRESGNSD